MIEVEKKFHLKPGDEAKLTSGATFIREITMHDVYYDTADYRLSLKNKWLRLRNTGFELKVKVTAPTPVQYQSRLGKEYPQFDELTTDDTIRRHLQIPGNGPLAIDLEKDGYRPFADLVTHRRVFERPPFTIDLDRIEGGDDIAEIELMVSAPGEVSSALQRIFEFATSLGLEVIPIRGKVFEYLRRHNPKHFQTLVDAGVIF